MTPVKLQSRNKSWKEPCWYSTGSHTASNSMRLGCFSVHKLLTVYCKLHRTCLSWVVSFNTSYLFSRRCDTRSALRLVSLLRQSDTVCCLFTWSPAQRRASCICLLCLCLCHWSSPHLSSPTRFTDSHIHTLSQAGARSGSLRGVREAAARTAAPLLLSGGLKALNCSSKMLHK